MNIYFRILTIFVACAACLMVISSCSENSVETEIKNYQPTVKISTINGLLDRLNRPLSSSNKSALIKYRGTCKKSHSSGYLVRFPVVKVSPVYENASGMNAIHLMFSSSPEATVKKLKKGLVEINIGEIWNKILNVKIDNLSLSDYEQYNPTLAIHAMFYTRQMQRAAKKFNLRSSVRVLVFVASPPQKGEPHLPDHIKNITIAQFLKKIARTFNGVVIYGSCMIDKNEPLIDISFGGYIDSKVKREVNIRGGERLYIIELYFEVVLRTC